MTRQARPEVASASSSSLRIWSPGMSGTYITCGLHDVLPLGIEHKLTRNDVGRRGVYVGIVERIGMEHAGYEQITHKAQSSFELGCFEVLRKFSVFELPVVRRAVHGSIEVDEESLILERSR